MNCSRLANCCDPIPHNLQPTKQVPMCSLHGIIKEYKYDSICAEVGLVTELVLNEA